MANYQVYFTKDGSTWYGAGGAPGADPVANTGGIDLSVLAGTLMYPTLQGTGDIITTANFGQNAFVHSVPAGYTSGWPHSGGGFTTLDAAKAQGSGAITGGTGNLGCTFNTVAGMIQAVDGYTTGQYYFELTQGHMDVFCQWGLGGVGQNFTINGGDYNHWISSGAFKTGNPNGGALVRSQDAFNAVKTTIQSLGAQLVSDPFTTLQNTTIGIAVFLTASGPPPASSVSIADMWFGRTASFVDLTQVANRRKFISDAGCTVNLGASGQNPTGQSPSVFLSRFTGNPANSFSNNLGNGGTFAITGGDLTDAASAPCCTTTSTTTFTPASLGNGVVGDYRNGNLYAFNMDTLLDNGTQRKWLRTWRALEKPKNTTTKFSSLRIDMETGSTNNPSSGNPQVVLRWSDDGGATWSVPRIIPAGKVGNTIASVRATRLGSTRRFARDDRIFELSSTDEFKVGIVGADVDVS